MNNNQQQYYSHLHNHHHRTAVVNRQRPVHILYCTGNQGKFAEASIIVNNWLKENYGWGIDIRLIQADPDPTEVQGSDRQIAVQKCVSAYESVKYTGALTIDIDFVITEDVGLRLDALNGFPGPYCKPMLETIGVEGLANLVLKYDEEKGERNAMATCTLAVLETSVAFKYPFLYTKAKEYEKDGYTWSEEPLTELEKPERVANIKRDHWKRTQKAAAKGTTSWKDQVMSAEGQGCTSCFI